MLSNSAQGTRRRWFLGIPLFPLFLGGLLHELSQNQRPAPKERQDIARGVSPGIRGWLQVRALKGREPFSVVGNDLGNRFPDGNFLSWSEAAPTFSFLGNQKAGAASGGESGVKSFGQHVHQAPNFHLFCSPPSERSQSGWMISSLRSGEGDADAGDTLCIIRVAILPLQV